MFMNKVCRGLVQGERMSTNSDEEKYQTPEKVFRCKVGNDTKCNAFIFNVIIEDSRLIWYFKKMDLV